MTAPKKLVIIGATSFAEIAYEYFKKDSDYEPVAFAVNQAYRDKEELFSLPVLALEELEKHCPPDDHHVYVAMTYAQLNRIRTSFVDQMKARGYSLASYISSKAFIWDNAEIGEHCFIFEDNTIQPFTKIGNNVVMWSGNHVGHHSIIKDNVFISSHVVICGHCEIGENSFLAVNSVVANNVVIAADNFLNSGANVMKSTKVKEIYNPVATEIAKIDSFKLFKVNSSNAMA